MRMIKNSTWAIALFAITVPLLVVYMICNNRNNYHSFLNKSDYKLLSRPKQLAYCANCHKTEFENELKGPHANAYNKLMEHIEFINSNKYDCKFYTDRTNKRIEDCMECHASVNLWETRLQGGLTMKDSMADYLLNNSFLPDSRTGNDIRKTGVDCFTCHYDNGQIVSLKNAAAKLPVDIKLYTTQKIVADNLVCFPCHDNECKTFNPTIAIAQKGTINCISCHQEYDAHNKPTHYFYWSHNAASKTDPKLRLLLNDFDIRLSAKRNYAEILWRNTSVPHKLAPFPETILNCQILSVDSLVLGATVIRLNNRKDFNELMFESCGRNYLPGIDGEEVLLNDSVKKYSVPLTSGNKAAMLKITMLHKGQYWFPDSVARELAVRLVPIK